MVKSIRRLFSVLGRINTDTHLWCISVLCGAVLLCISFFVEPSQRQLAIGSEDAQQLARQIVIEYSSVLGGLSGLESLEHEDVEEIVEAIPDHSDDEGSETGEDGGIACPAVCDFYEYAKNVSIPDNKHAVIDISNVYPVEAIDALERLVQCEAATEDTDGRILVADVVLNRVDTGIWGDDIISVIEAPGQFRPVDNGAVKSVEVDDITKEAVLSALSGADNSHGAIYFQKSEAKVWGDKEYLFRHGSHSFYK